MVGAIRQGFKRGICSSSHCRAAVMDKKYMILRVSSSSCSRAVADLAMWEFSLGIFSGNFLWEFILIDPYWSHDLINSGDFNSGNFSILWEFFNSLGIFQFSESFSLKIHIDHKMLLGCCCSGSFSLRNYNLNQISCHCLYISISI